MNNNNLLWLRANFFYINFISLSIYTVSYTHLDVYKRQVLHIHIHIYIYIYILLGVSIDIN